MERFDFLPVAGEKILTITHPVADQTPGAGVLMVHPFGEEKLWVGRSSTGLARALCEAGVPAMRFDFRGYGDSDRLHHEIDLHTMEADLKGAAAAFRESCGIRELHLFGFRLGGTLALHCADALAAASVALINPVSAGEGYLMKALRSNLTTQMNIHGEVLEDRDTLIKKMNETGLLNIDGYHLSKGFFETWSGVDILKSPPPFSGPGLVMSLVRREGGAPDAESRKVFEATLAANPSSRIQALRYPTIWGEQKRFAVGDRELFSPIVEWVLQDWRKGAA